MKNRLLSLFLCLCPLLLSAQSDSTGVVRPVISAYSFEIGSSHVCDTYLTPLHYSGWSAALSYERLQAMRFAPERWIMQLDGRVEIGKTLNPARSAALWELDFRPRWGMMRRFFLPYEFSAAIGPQLSADLGVLYMARNSNNPASARAALTANATAMAVWNGRVGKLPLTLRYQPSLAVLGAFFSPDYDELYYEIWLGNHSGLCHAAWWGNYFRMDNLLTADLHFGATTLRLGYRCDIMSTKASGIVTRNVAHMFVVGITTEWLSLRSGSRRTPDARIISAMY